MCTESHPRAVYTDFDDTDISPGVAALQAAGFTVTHLGTRSAQAIVDSDPEVLLVGYAQITAEMIERMPNLRLIALMSMGHNNIDVEKATQRGVWVSNILGAATEEVATHALALILHQSRQLGFYQGSATPHGWNDRAQTLPARLSEATLGIVGIGRIGVALAQRAAPLFGRVIGFDSQLDHPDSGRLRSEAAAAGILTRSVDEVVASADVLSLHLPLTEQTEQMVDATFLQRMRPGSTLINVSRGALVDSEALRAAVDSGHLAGAGLDVLDVEPPPPDHPLLNHPRILVTPHIGYLSARTESEYVRLQVENVLAWLNTGTPVSPVNQVMPAEHTVV